MKRWLLKLLALAVAAAWLLSGCASGYLLDNTVQSFSNLPTLPAQPSYRFDRLPSQQSPAQAQLEAWADPALHKAGLRRDDSTPRYAVQVTGRLDAVLSPWADPWRSGGWRGGWGMGFHHRGFGFGMGGPWGGLGESPWYHREVAVIVRELPGNRVVFESHASNDGPWLDNAAVFPAMFDAAMQGFPNPPAGPRQVNIQIGGTKP
jgi:hypothetical protein